MSPLNTSNETAIPVPRTWQIRLVGSPELLSVAGPNAIVEGLREGTWDTTDEVRSPTEELFQPIEDHPVFRDVVAEMGPPPTEKLDETHLDMNPLIDVALVLLIFFILTTSYASLRRTIDLPPSPDPEAGSRTVKAEDIKDRTFKMSITLENDAPVVRLESRVIPMDDVYKEMRDHVKSTGRKELFLYVDDRVKWEAETKVLDAARGAGIVQIYYPNK